MSGQERSGERWLRYGAACLLLYTFYVLWQVNFYLAESLAAHLVPAAVIALLTLYFSRRGLSDGAELKLYAAYCLWFVLTRVACGDPALRIEWPLVFAQLVCLTLLSAGLTQNERGRDRLLLWAAAVLSLYIFAVSGLCLYASVAGRQLYSPITEGMLVYMARTPEGYLRLCAMDQSPNVIGLWFYLGLCMTLWLFARCRGRARLLRVPLLLAVLADFTALALTQSRNAKLALAVSAALLAMLPVQRALRVKKKAVLALILALTAAAALPAAYLAGGAAAQAVGRISAAASERTEAGETAEPENAAGAGAYTDQRAVFEDTGRMTIYRSAIESLRREPLRLLRGCLSTRVMASLNETAEIEHAHFHNLFLEVLNLTGLPGFGLAAAFCLLLLIRCVRLFFDPQAPMTLRLLVLPIVGSLQYNMLEVNLFMDLDLRSASFFLLAGFLLGGYSALYPKKQTA